MPRTDSLSTPNKGMLQDVAMLNTDSNTYGYALNSISSDFFTGEEGFLQNEPSNVLSVTFPPGYQVVGFVEVPEQNRTIYLLTNPITGNSQIGEILNCNYTDHTDAIQGIYCKDCPEPMGIQRTPLEQQDEQPYCQYRLILTSPCLQFSVHYPVDIEYKLGNCSLNIYFTDNINERRYIYFNYENDDVTQPLYLQDRFKVQTGETDDECKTPIYSDDLDCSKIKFHPDYERPCIEFLGFTGGGNLKAGTYQVLVAYADVYGSPISQYFPATQPAALSEDLLVTDTAYTTTKAMHFRINNLKISDIFKYYNIVIAQTISNFTEFIQVGTFNTTLTDYVYTGFESGQKQIDAAEVFARRPYYKTATGITKANDYLFFSNAQAYKTPNLQPIANKIKLQWVTVAMREGDYRNAFNGVYYRGYQRDEVYSLGIVFEYDNGRELPALHIPGREVTPADIEPVTSPNDYIKNTSCSPITSCNGTIDPTGKHQPRWMVYNTGSVTGGLYQYNIDCNTDSCWEFGEFSYWESTMRYPNIPEVWGDLCGQCIRHHKFPDSRITHIHDGKDSDNREFFKTNYIYPIGIKVDHEQIKQLLDEAVTTGLITQQERDTIVSYRIVRGNRVGNKSIVAKGLIYDMLSYAETNRHGDTSQGLNRDYWFANYPYNDIRPDAYLEDVRVPTGFNDRFAFHSPDTTFTNAALGTILKVETEEYGQSDGYFTPSECEAKQKLLSIFIQTMAVGLGISAALSATSPDGSNQLSTSGDSPGSVISNSLTKDAYDIFTGNKTVTSPFQSYFNKKKQLFTGSTSANLQRLVLMLNETQKILEGIKAIAPYKNLSYQYNSVGKYNCYTLPEEGTLVRNILTAAYLSPDIQTVDDYNGSTEVENVYSTEYINNWNREESVYLKLDQWLWARQKTDFSKQTMTTQFDGKIRMDTHFRQRISSYYVSIKNYVPDQYGQVCNINYLEASNCSFYLNKEYDTCSTKVYGGDTFINRFAFKRKFPLFQHTMCNLPDGSDVKYTDIGNVATPRYYYNTMEPLSERLFPGLFEGAGSITDLNAVLSTSNIDNTFSTIFDGITAGGAAISLANGNKHNYDGVDSNAFYQNGRIPLFVYGIPYFLVESDVNVDLRYAENNKEKDFYPHVTDVKNWLQEDVVPIAQPNYYLYNNTYSKQNHESPITTSCITNWHDFLCENINFNRLIYSKQQQQVEGTDNWLNFLANDYYDFPLTYGKLITADGIEDDKVLVRLTKATQIFAAYNTIQATGANIQVGTGGLFRSRPQDIAVTDLGYAGTQNRDIKHTEYGHFWADAERGNVFNLENGGGNITELGKDGMHSFFKQNLPFQINRDFPEYQDIDNNLNGVGLHYGFDKRFNRILMTKLDYKCLDKQAVKYDAELRQFYVLNTDNTRKQVQLYDPKYFCNKSWTISYDLSNQCWKSFHTYKPAFYNDHIANFDSSIIEKVVINGILSPQQKLYTHGATNKSYQVFYGKLEPFIVDVTSKQSINNNTITSVEYYTDAIRYHNEYDQYHDPTVTFNKAIISTPNSTSGLLHLHVSNPEDFTEVATYPKRVPTGYEVLVTNTEDNWRFNDFFDVTRNTRNNVPIFTYLCNNADKQLNPLAVNYDKPEFDRNLIRGKMCNIRLIQDADSNHKLIFAFTKIQQRQSYR